MTSKQRSQYMALSVVEGFVFYARNIKQLGPKSHKAFDRINARCANMKEALGEVDINTDSKHILNKHDKIQAVINKYSEGGQVDVMFYINAVIMMVNKMQDNIPSIHVLHQWESLEGMLYTLYTHFEEVDAISSTMEANEMGVEMTLAVLS